MRPSASAAACRVSTALSRFSTVAQQHGHGPRIADPAQRPRRRGAPAGRQVVVQEQDARPGRVGMAVGRLGGTVGQGRDQRIGRPGIGQVAQRPGEEEAHPVLDRQLLDPRDAGVEHARDFAVGPRPVPFEGGANPRLVRADRGRRATGSAPRGSRDRACRPTPRRSSASASAISGSASACESPRAARQVSTTAASAPLRRMTRPDQRLAVVVLREQRTVDVGGHRADQRAAPAHRRGSIPGASSASVIR